MDRQRLLLSILLGLALSMAAGCGKIESLITGETMGTTYHVKVITHRFTDIKDLKQRIDEKLESVNRSMSTYRPDSEISRFNRIAAAGEKFPASADFYRVMTMGKELFRITDGAWDGTVDPLVNLWGFGRKGPAVDIPDDPAIRDVLSGIGFRHINFLPDNTFSKKIPMITVDLASIAKGFGVDAIAALLTERKIDNFIVEIGGEVYASGVRTDNTEWRVGINTPVIGASQDAVYKVVPLKNRGFATSGDYRNYVEIGGKRFSHIIDPRTGYPVSNGVVSVSVVAPTCALADGLATAIMVMGKDDGIGLLNRLENVEGFVVVSSGDGGLKDYKSKGFVVID
ncbi:MAG: FAD:protein FMN transferase [Desulfobacteraceae bacterium]|nr:FAD:protein FMN transferase [Desulfobacteraceae bacterium]